MKNDVNLELSACSNLKPRPAGPNGCVGFHYDLHATVEDTDLGLGCDPSKLAAMLRRSGADFVQTDCKGHPGYTSWFSKVPEASVPPQLKTDALFQWRAATRELGIPLNCHYSGIWDAAAAAKHPEWVAVRRCSELDSAVIGQNQEGKDKEWMCPRSGYLTELLIPQMLELIDRYEVDGFWIDGDIWAVEPCYCERCATAFRAKTGLTELPVCGSDPNWPAWWNFTRESFEEYVTAYTNAVHAHKPGVLVCSNWLQSFCHPGEPRVPTDWISGDNAQVWGLDQSRCESRFISTRGKPWDIMLWAFYFPRWRDPSSPRCFKPVDMLVQEAAVILSHGGAVQLYEYVEGVRDGRLIGWHQDRLGEVARFVKERWPLCCQTETVPQIAVLYSEHHVRATVTGKNVRNAVDNAPVAGAVFALLENHYGVDVLDEWALGPRLSEFPAVVVPEQHRLSDAIVSALTDYANGGGTLVITGADCGARWPDEFLGVTGGSTASERIYHVPAGSEAIPVFSKTWRLLELRGAKPFGSLALSDAIEEDSIGHPAASIHRRGKGCVMFVPFDLFRDFKINRYPPTRRFVGDLIAALDIPWEVEVDAPLCIDVTLRKRGNVRFAHLVNRISGIPNQPENGAVDSIPAVGPITVNWRMPHRPKSVSLVFEQATIEWSWNQGQLTVKIPSVRIHAALEVELSAM